MSFSIIPSNDMTSFNDDEPILSTEDLSEGKLRLIMRGKLRLITRGKEDVKKTKQMKNPVSSMSVSKLAIINKPMPEMLRTYIDHDRPGMDIVTVLDVSSNNLKLLDSVLENLIIKLLSIDRLSIIISSSKPTKLCPLRQISESALDDFTMMIDNLTLGPDRNISAGVQMGLEVINSRRFTTGRFAAIMLMSDDGALNEYCTAQVQLGNVPVYTFALGTHYDPKKMNEISLERLGETFFTIRNTAEARLSFTQCFARLFAVKYRPSTDDASSSFDIWSDDSDETFISLHS